MSDLFHALRQALQETRPKKWLFYGDSISEGREFTYGARDYTQLLAEHVRGDLNRRTDVFINTAISGNIIIDLLNGFNWRVEQFHPDFVFIMIGTNDCSPSRGVSPDEFRRNLSHLCDRILKQGSLLVLQTPNPPFPGAAPERANLENYLAFIRSLAAERNIPLIDHAKYWTSLKGFPCEWMSDAVHPNAFGHVALARYCALSADFAMRDSWLFKTPIPSWPGTP